MNLIVEKYMGRDIQFEVRNGEVYANATEMCKSFGKEVRRWTALESTQRYVKALTGKTSTALIQSKTGGLTQGTWIHEKLILKLAQWINVDFEIWCDEQIARLLRNGAVTIVETKEVAERYGAKSIGIEEVKEVDKFYEAVMLKDKGVLATTIGEINDTSAREINKVIEKFGVIRRDGNKWYLTEDYKGKDLVVERKDGSIQRWTERGAKVVSAMYNTKELIKLPASQLSLFRR